MRDPKLLLPLSLFFLLLSFALVIFWGYRFFYDTPVDQTTSSSTTGQKTAQPTPALKSTQGRDSLMTIYNSTLNGMDQKLDSTLSDANFLKNELDGKLSEFQKLKKEIVHLLRDPANQADLNMAKTKIAELQQRVDDLKLKNSDVASENRRLNEIIQQLKNDKKDR